MQPMRPLLPPHRGLCHGGKPGRLPDGKNTFEEQHCGVRSTDDVLLQYCEPTPLTDEGVSHLYTQNGWSRSILCFSAGQPVQYLCRPPSNLPPFTHFRRGPVSAAGILNTASVLMITSSITSSAGRCLSKTGSTATFPGKIKEFLKQQYRAIPEIGKLMRRIPEELRRASVFKILFYHYYNFDLDQPFLPQYEQNNRSLLHDLRQLALLD